MKRVAIRGLIFSLIAGILYFELAVDGMNIGGARKWMETLYQEEFSLTKGDGENEYFAYPKSNPEIQVDVRTFRDWFKKPSYTIYIDNYLKVCIEYALDHNEKLKDYMQINNDDYVFYAKEENFGEIAEEIAATLDKAFPKKYFNEDLVWIYVCGIYQGQDSETVRISIDDYLLWEGEKEDMISQAFRESLEKNEIQWKREKKWEDDQKKAQEGTWDISPQIEGTFLSLYEELLKPQGYVYKVTSQYALRAWIEREELKGTNKKEMIVFDRFSENQKCHLYVHYSSLYDENGNELTTGIKNMYAVDIETGEVFISEKKAWADVGTKEYREATGE